jgi:hypothetical protein
LHLRLRLHKRDAHRLADAQSIRVLRARFDQKTSLARSSVL